MHAAYNLTIGEIFETSHGNHLKRLVAEANRLEKALGLGKGRWIFAHGKDAVKKVCAKAVAIQKRG